MNIGNLTILEDTMGNIQIFEGSTYVIINFNERKRLAEVLSRREPREKCTVCSRPSNYFICSYCQDKSVEASAPQIRWQVQRNGKKVLSGTTSWMKACTHFTKYIEKMSEKVEMRWDQDGQFYEDAQGNRFILKTIAVMPPPGPIVYEIPRIFSENAV